jgi:large subunit ribosomal protein L4e
MQTAAESWGTGRAVSRIPRVPGGGTHRAGQGAFGNMCRGGRMFAPTKTWRRWCHKISIGQKRYARVSALAASSEPALLEARGHKISKVPELPLVVSDDIESYDTTKKAVLFLKRIGAYDEVSKVKSTKKVRAGKGKARNRRYVLRKGPLVVYKKDSGIVKAFRNIPGLDLSAVENLSILQLAPGSHVGRFIIWTESAFKELVNIYGSYGDKSVVSKLKTRQGQVYKLPNPVSQNTDFKAIVRSETVQSVLRDRKIVKNKIRRKLVCPWNVPRLMVKLNPAHKVEKKEVKDK